MTRFLFRLSKPIHKYLVLVGLLYFFVMAVSGILLNHPSLIRAISIGPDWLPSSYRIANWNRMAMREAVFDSNDSSIHYICGKTGVWASRDGGRSYTHLDKGFPASAYDRDTNCILSTKIKDAEYLLAGTRNGIYAYDMGADAPSWSRIDQEERLADTDFPWVPPRLRDSMRWAPVHRRQRN
jgi:hypothetical protein